MIRPLAIAVLASLTIGGGAALLAPEPADAAVCARGVGRAGCVGPRGSVVVHRGVVAPRRVVVRRRRW